MEFGFSYENAKSMISFTDYSDVENAIKAVRNQIKNGNAKKPKAMIRTALKEKWKDNSVEENKKNKQKKIIEESNKAEKSVSRKTGFMKIFEYLFRR